ncbi:MAG: PaaI family thioesterase, partial [Bacteroidales bacterium]|nr:PaaI family thioesterase [Bacteroidales bacterium]
RCELAIDGRHRNAMGAVMGGVIFTLADFCFAVAANAEKLSVVSVSSNIVYLNAVRGTKLIAEAQCLKSGRKNCFFRIVVTDELGTLVAEITETGCRVEGC